MSEAEVLYSVDNYVATITLNRPKTLNAFTGDNIKQMQELMDKASNDRDVGVIVLTGSGERAFCVGGDSDVIGPAGQSRAVERVGELPPAGRAGASPHAACGCCAPAALRSAALHVSHRAPMYPWCHRPGCC